MAQSVQWRMVVRAMAEEVDTLAGAGERDDLLRGVGRRLSRLMPLPAVHTLDALEIEMNEALEQAGLGAVKLELHEADRSMRLLHTGLPRLGSIGTPSGMWLSAMLEGLYDGWLAQQPGAKASLSATRLESNSPADVLMSYHRR